MRVSKNEWESITGFDETENFNYQVAILDEEGCTKEYETHQTSGLISFQFDGQRVWVSSLAYVPSLEEGHLINQGSDGYGKIEEWSFDHSDNLEGVRCPSEKVRVRLLYRIDQRPS
jgi:hypothetical protein